MLLGKILNELTLIRKELQAICPELKPKCDKDIHVIEKKYINQEHFQVTVSFELSDRDWCELSELPAWREVENYLSQQERIDNQNFHITVRG